MHGHAVLFAAPLSYGDVTWVLQRKLAELVGASASGDLLVFHYSGHGTQVGQQQLQQQQQQLKQ
jgi:hypothetical protein